MMEAPPPLSHFVDMVPKPEFQNHHEVFLDEQQQQQLSDMFVEPLEDAFQTQARILQMCLQDDEGVSVTSDGYPWYGVDSSPSTSSPSTPSPPLPPMPPLPWHAAAAAAAGGFATEPALLLQQCQQYNDKYEELTGEEPRSCLLCRKHFVSKVSLSRHLRTIHGPRVWYPCNVCGKQLSTRNSLFQHLYLHTGERPYSCPDCPAGYVRKRQLIRHRETKHRDVLERQGGLQDDGHHGHRLQDDGHRSHRLQDDGHQGRSLQDDGHHGYGLQDGGHHGQGLQDDGLHGHRLQDDGQLGNALQDALAHCLRDYVGHDLQVDLVHGLQAGDNGLDDLGHGLPRQEVHEPSIVLRLKKSKEEDGQWEVAEVAHITKL